MIEKKRKQYILKLHFMIKNLFPKQEIKIILFYLFLKIKSSIYGIL